MSSGINKITAERNLRMVLELVNQPGNDACADCKTRNPRWASYNLGIFICVHCASIHRKMGTHISKVKSLTMDTWTKEEVEIMKANGNVKSNAHYNPDETRHPPPTNMIDQERDSDLEKYIRYKYEYKKFISRSAQVAALLGPSKSASGQHSNTGPARSPTMPLSSSSSMPSSSQVSPAPPIPSAAPLNTPINMDSLLTQSQIRSAPQPVASLASLPTQVQPHLQARPATQPPQQQPSNSVWQDLAQLQAPAADSSLPLQSALPTTIQHTHHPGFQNTGLTAPNQFSGLSVNANIPSPTQLAPQQQTGAMFSGGVQPSMSLNAGLGVNGGMNFGGMVPGTTSASPSMPQPQPTTATFLSHSQRTTPSPNPFGPGPRALIHTEPSLAPASFAQQMLPHYHNLPTHLQPSPMMVPQSLGLPPAFIISQQQAFESPPMSHPGMFMHGQAQFRTSQPAFVGTPVAGPYVLQQQQPLSQPSSGWQQTGLPDQQQQW